MKINYLIFIFYLFLIGTVRALNITAAGGWTETINATDLLGGAGTDLNPTYTSPANATLINISGCVDKRDMWGVDIKRSDSVWHANFILSAQRTSRGTGQGTVTGGNRFTVITTTDVRFFDGKGDRNNIEIQYELTGMSINVVPNSYTTTITYTVIDT